MGKKKIRILFIIDSIFYGKGGTETQLLRIFNSLDSQKYDLNLLVLMDTPWYQDILKRNVENIYNISIHKFKKIQTYIGIIKLIKFIKKLNPDIVHTFFPTSNSLGVFASKIAGVKNIISSRRDFGEWITPSRMILTKIVNPYVKKIITNSYAVKELTIKIEGVDPDKIDVIYNGLDIQWLIDKIITSNLDIRDELNLSNQIKIIGTIANLRPMKHIDTLLLAAKLVIKNNPDIYFVIVGTGPEEEKLKQLANDIGINNHVHFAGRQFDIYKYLKAFDIAVNCSERESLSNAIMEYLAAGIPVIVSDAGGNTELIKDGINGFVIRLGDYKALADKLLLLLSDNTYCRNFKINSSDILKQLELSVMINNFDKLYSSMTTTI